MKTSERLLRSVIRNIIAESFGLTKLSPDLEREKCNKLQNLDLNYLKNKIDNPNLRSTSFLPQKIVEGDIVYCDPTSILNSEYDMSSYDHRLEEKTGIYIVLGFAEDLYTSQSAGGGYLNISPSKSDRENTIETMYVADEFGKIFEVLLDKIPLIEKVYCK